MSWDLYVFMLGLVLGFGLGGQFSLWYLSHKLNKRRAEQLKAKEK